MNQQITRFLDTRAPGFLNLGVIGGLLGWALHGRPILAAVKGGPTSGRRVALLGSTRTSELTNDSHS
jgi:hypothetical protein